MQNIFGMLGGLLGYVLWAAFYLLKDFGLSIIVFTIVIKLVLFPFSVKQQKSMAGNMRLQKKQKEIQEKYANNRVLLQEEMSKLYEKEGVKPMGGCLTTLVPFLVILGIFYAVAYPLTNTLHLSSDSISKAIDYVNSIPGYAISSTNNAARYQEIELLRILPNIANTDTIQSIFSDAEMSRIIELRDGFNILGFDLLTVPKNEGVFSAYILIPIICFISYIGSQIVMQKMNGNPMANQQGCMKTMLYVMPLFSAYIAYTVPASVGFYWICSSITGLIQSIIINKLFSAVILTAKEEARHVALMQINEEKIPYIYAPKDVSGNDSSNLKKKKKK